jgi:flagellar hook-associated protein 3 FlgL
MSESISSLSKVNDSLALMQASEQTVNKLAQQNSTGTQSTSLAGYGTQASTILNLNSSIAETKSWLSNSTQVNTYLSAYNSALSELSSDATQLQTALASFGSGGGTSSSDLATLINGLQADVTATLNTQVGDRYIFAGNRYTTAPTVALSSLAVPTTPTAISLASNSTTPPTIPEYDVAYAGTTNGQVTSGTQYYAQQTATIGNNETVTYGVSADDSTIQNLVYALQQAKAATQTSSTTNSAAFIANAKSAVSTAITGLSTVTESNTTAQTTISSAQSVQKASVSLLQNQVADITQVDSATIAAELTAAENQLEGSYKATSTLLNLTILTYLT